MSDSDVPMYGDSEDGFESPSEADDDFGFDEPASGSPMAHLRPNKYRVLNRDQLEERQQQVVQETADLLCVSANESARVLRFYKWDAGKLQDEWFNDPDAVRSKVGLVEEQPGTRRRMETCAICMEPHPVAAMASARCKHYFCADCWAGYANTAVDGGPACLDLRCPLPDCAAVVPTDLVERSVDEAHLRRYRSFSLRSFVDDNKLLAWCPAPGCAHAAEALVDAPREALDVRCACGEAYCFTCGEEAHRPVDCGTVRRWMVKNSAESENLTWILANTKPCPKCARAIEKNQGCMHMTCSQCRHEFCWLCQGPWSEHGERTGGYYACNTYKKAADGGAVDEAESQRQRARQSLERYMHYWQRWAEHDKARRSALKELEAWEGEQMEALSARTATPSSQLRFVLDAWREVVNCRRVLKWTYASSYYSFDYDDGDARGGAGGSGKAAKGAGGAAAAAREAAHKQFFEFTQQDAESSLEKMTGRLEKELPAFLAEGGGGEAEDARWASFRQELIGLTDVTRSQFAKLVDFLEQGLEAGLAQYTGPAVDEAGASGSGTGGASGSGTAGAGAGPSGSGASAGTGAGGSNVNGKGKGRWSARTRSGAKAEASAGAWQCGACTFSNDSGADCEMCGLPRAR